MKRVMAVLVTASLGLGSAGCHPHVDCSSMAYAGGSAPFGVLTNVAIWLAECGSRKANAEKDPGVTHVPRDPVSLIKLTHYPDPVLAGFEP